MGENSKEIVNNNINKFKKVSKITNNIYAKKKKENSKTS